MRDKLTDNNKAQKYNRRVVLVALITIMALLGGCKAKSNKSQEASTAKTMVKIAYLPLTHALPLFAEKDLLEENKDSKIQIELVKYGSWPELLDALNSGRVDGASVLIELAMKAKSEGIGIKAVALGHRDGNAIVVANDINSVKDLKGKKFAIPHRQSSHNILLNDMLIASNMTINDIEVVELAPAEMPSALSGGQISGYCVAEPFGAKAVNMGIGKALYQSADIWENSLCCGLVLTEKFLNKNQADADFLVDQYLKAGNQLDLEKAQEVAKKYLDQEEEVLKLSLQWISYDNLVISEEDYNVLVDKIKEYKISDKAPSYEEFVYKK